MIRKAFSMIELVFVIVILGVLAAVAVPKFVASRSDAKVAALRSDIATALKTIPSRIFAENIDITSTNAPDGTSWSDWMIDTAGLDKNTWGAAINPGGITPRTSSKIPIPCSSSGIIAIDNVKQTLVFDPDALKATNQNSADTVCVQLKNSYPSGSGRTIPLGSNGLIF